MRQVFTQQECNVISLIARRDQISLRQQRDAYREAVDILCKHISYVALDLYEQSIIEKQPEREMKKYLTRLEAMIASVRLHIEKLEEIN